MRKSVYTRIEEDILRKVREYAKSSGLTLSATLEDLVARGLLNLEASAKVERAERDLASLKDETQQLRQEKGELVGRLQVCQKNESLALAARQQAELVKSQFEQILLVGVATCGRQGCGQTWRLYDVWRHQCPRCGNATAKLLTDYTPPLTTGEGIRDVLAVVGGATALVGLLKAMSGGGEES